IMEYDSNTMVSNTQWSIEDDSLFQPCGLVSAHAGKSVFITWNYSYLLNFCFKKPKGNDKVKMSRVRIPLPLLEGCLLRNVYTLKFNTILVMSDGALYCFGSFQTLNAVRWLKGVRCLALTDLGFSVIREKDHQLLLQTYLDLPDLEKSESTLQHSFDITFDKNNIFESGFRDEYSLISVEISEKEKRFMNILFGIKDATQCHIFSIAGHIFALFCNTDEMENNEKSYHVELFYVYSVSVRFIRILPLRNLCLVFLKNGTVDMWYLSNLLGVKQRQIYHTGSEWLDYDGTSKNGDFFYTNGEVVVRLKFEFNRQLDKCIVITSSVTVPGIQVCTWIEHSKQLISLSQNNIFHHIEFSLEKDNNTVKPSQNCDIMLDSTQHLLQNIWSFDTFKRQFYFLKEKITGEHQKQHVISVGRYSENVKKMFNVSAEFQQKPVWDENFRVLKQIPETNLLKNIVYVIIHVVLNKIKSCLHYKNWQLLTFYENEAHIHLLPREVLLDKTFKMAIPIKKSKNELVPLFDINLLAYIDIKNETSAVRVPIFMENKGLTHQSLFNENKTSFIYRPKNYLQHTKKSQSMIYHEIQLPFNLALSLSSLFNVNTKTKGDTFDLMVMDSSLRLKVFESYGHGTLESMDASSIFYFKEHLLQNSPSLD
ncbi:hypothetical protein KR074_005345, partial [Drosophila pseudoananassae]